MSERKWSCGCYEHDGVVTPCKVEPKLNPTCFRLQEDAATAGKMLEIMAKPLDAEHSPVESNIIEYIPEDETQS